MSTDRTPPVCFRCGLTPDAIEEYCGEAEADEMTADEVAREDGTFNPAANTFACTSCYVAIGCPSSPSGWVAPARTPSQDTTP